MPPPPSLAASPVAPAFPHIQWDPLGSLRLTAQETALLRMAETNPIEYTLADSRDASMYARVLLKVVAEASAAASASGGGAGVSSTQASRVRSSRIRMRGELTCRPAGRRGTTDP